MAGTRDCARCMDNCERTKTVSEPKKTTKPVVAMVEPVEHTTAKSSKQINAGAVFWGFALIFYGALLLLSNFGVITIYFENLIRLWPILIIGTGVSLLSPRGWLGAVVAFLLVVVLALLTWLVAVDGSLLAPTMSPCSLNLPQFWID